MLDFFLVLGIIPGTSIQLNLYEILLLPILLFVLYRNRNFAKVYTNIESTGRSAFKSPSFRSFVIWMALTFDRPRDRQIRVRLFNR